MNIEIKTGKTRQTLRVNIALIRSLRIMRGLRQCDLADLIGYAASRVSHFELGSPGYIPIEAIKKMAEIFEIDYEDLLIKDPEC